jgi:hypothetical protein
MREKTGTGLQVGLKCPVGGSVPVIFISMAGNEQPSSLLYYFSNRLVYLKR